MRSRATGASGEEPTTQSLREGQSLGDQISDVEPPGTELAGTELAGTELAGTGTADASAAETSSAQPVGPSRHPLAPTRASRAWVRVLPSVVVLAIILVFVFQNLPDVKVRFLSLSGTLPLALALLIAAALGGLFVLALGSIRILQLRKAVRRTLQSDVPHRRWAKKRPTGA